MSQPEFTALPHRTRSLSTASSSNEWQVIYSSLSHKPRQPGSGSSSIGSNTSDWDLLDLVDEGTLNQPPDSLAVSLGAQTQQFERGSSQESLCSLSDAFERDPKGDTEILSIQGKGGESVGTVIPPEMGEEENDCVEKQGAQIKGWNVAVDGAPLREGMHVKCCPVPKEPLELSPIHIKFTDLEKSLTVKFSLDWYLFTLTFLPSSLCDEKVKENQAKWQWWWRDLDGRKGFELCAVEEGANPHETNGWNLKPKTFRVAVVVVYPEATFYPLQHQFFPSAFGNPTVKYRLTAGGKEGESLLTSCNLNLGL